MIKVCWHPYIVPLDSDRLISPSAGKPIQVVQDWAEHNLPIEIVESGKASVFELCYAHNRRFVKGIVNGTIPNGFGTVGNTVAESCRYGVGSMIRAADLMLAGEKVVCSPTSGFHHAGWNGTGPFCTFNGLMIAAMRILDSNSEMRVGILDMDHHYGDGTKEIIERLCAEESIVHATGFWGNPLTLLDSIESVIREMSVDFLFYQAGADQCVDDPLGGVFTVDQMVERDRIVFETCKSLDLPVCWNLAGGYQKDFKKVIEIHRNTMKACIDVFG